MESDRGESDRFGRSGDSSLSRFEASKEMEGTTEAEPQREAVEFFTHVFDEAIQLYPGSMEAVVEALERTVVSMQKEEPIAKTKMQQREREKKMQALRDFIMSPEGCRKMVLEKLRQTRTEEFQHLIANVEQVVDLSQGLEAIHEGGEILRSMCQDKGWTSRQIDELLETFEKQTKEKFLDRNKILGLLRREMAHEKRAEQIVSLFADPDPVSSLNGLGKVTREFQKESEIAQALWKLLLKAEIPALFLRALDREDARIERQDQVRKVSDRIATLRREYASAPPAEREKNQEEYNEEITALRRRLRTLREGEGKERENPFEAHTLEEMEQAFESAYPGSAEEVHAQWKRMREDLFARSSQAWKQNRGYYSSQKIVYPAYRAWTQGKKQGQRQGMAHRM